MTDKNNSLSSEEIHFLESCGDPFDNLSEFEKFPQYAQFDEKYLRLANFLVYFGRFLDGSSHFSNERVAYLIHLFLEEKIDFCVKKGLNRIIVK
jgi:hypothetical protein